MRSLPRLPASTRTMLVAIAICLAQLIGTPVASTAATPPAYAGLVIDYGNGTVTYALVPVDDTITTGMSLLHASRVPLVTVSFGGLGEGVCRIETVGCDPGPCRARLCQTSDPQSPFWHYVQSANSDMWEVVPLGASSSHVRAGTVDGWFWSSTAPAAASPSLDAIARKVGVSLTDVPAGAIEPRLMTVGALPGTTVTATPGNALAGITILGLAAVISIALVWRSRLPRTHPLP